MVNVAGRSKGCLTCRKRRVKCDESRPICNRCLRCGFDCEGPKGTTFIEAVVRNGKTRESKAISTPSKVGDAGSTELYREHLSPSLRDSDFELSLCYTRQYLVIGGLLDLALQGVQLNDIISAGTNSANRQIFHQAVLSFATTLFGTQHRQEKIAKLGYAKHGLALSQLNQALSDSKTYTSDEIILSVVTLALKEAYVPSGPKNHLKHVIGLEKLLELRNPSLDYSPSSLSLYKGTGMMIISVSLLSERPSILARPEWKMAMRRNCTDDALQRQDLLDVLADCTGLVGERNELFKRSELDFESNARQRDAIQLKALGLLTNLRAWKERWDSDKSNFSFETSAAFAQLELQEFMRTTPIPFLTVLEFLNESAAILAMSYNTALIYVLRILSSLIVTPETRPNQNLLRSTLQVGVYLDGTSHGTRDEYNAAERVSALEICRCIPYYFAQRSGSPTGHSSMVHLAVITAWKSLGRDESTEGRWITDTLKAEGQEVIAKGLWES